jgi:hypothetical protein
LRITGSSRRSSGTSSSIVRLIAGPRPASALPKPCSAARALTRVSSSKMAVKSSISPALTRALRSGIVAPARKLRRVEPGVSSTYLSPSAERDLTLTAVSAASGSIVLSSFRKSRATERSSPSTILLALRILSTTPTRTPPARTSLPSTSLPALGSSAFRS